MSLLLRPQAKKKGDFWLCRFFAHKLSNPKKYFFLRKSIYYLVFVNSKIMRVYPVETVEIAPETRAYDQTFVKIAPGTRAYF